MKERCSRKPLGIPCRSTSHGCMCVCVHCMCMYVYVTCASTPRICSCSRSRRSCADKQLSRVAFFHVEHLKARQQSWLFRVRNTKAIATQLQRLRIVHAYTVAIRAYLILSTRLRKRRSRQHCTTQMRITVIT